MTFSHGPAEVDSYDYHNFDTVKKKKTDVPSLLNIHVSWLQNQFCRNMINRTG